MRSRAGATGGRRCKTMAFKGNKAALPQKTCQACGLPMTWRKRWALNWDQVRYCSDRCRAAPKPQAPDHVKPTHK